MNDTILNQSLSGTQPPQLKPHYSISYKSVKAWMQDMCQAEAPAAL